MQLPAAAAPLQRTMPKHSGAFQAADMRYSDVTTALKCFEAGSVLARPWLGGLHSKLRAWHCWTTACLCEAAAQALHRDEDKAELSAHCERFCSILDAAS